MAMNKLFLLGLITCIALTFSPAYSSDLEKEKRWASQIEDSLLDGDAIYLNDGTSDFLGLYTPAETPKPTAVIVLHGIGIHPDWPQIIYPVRTELPPQGWTTLSLQLPVLANDADPSDYKPLIDEATPRIAEGVKFLKKEGAEKVIIIAHSLGTKMSGRYLISKNADVIAYVAIGAAETAANYLGTLKIPTLDIYGAEDLDNVVAGANARKESGTKNKAYTQVKVEGANHFFDDKDEELLNIIVPWIENL